MFQEAALKLTAWYLGLIMLLSTGMSIAIYHVSSNDLNSGATFQVGYFNNFLPQPEVGNFKVIRSQQLDSDLTHLRTNLVLFNLVVLVLGSAASYELARRTLGPIETSHEAQRRFAGDASHELRTPLTVIKSEIEVALRNPKLTRAEAVKQLRSNLEEAEKLKSLSDGLLKLTAGEQSLNGHVTDLAAAAEAAITHHKKSAGVKQIKISSDLKRVKIRGDSTSLVQLVSILLDNAIKYSPSRSQIMVSVWRQGGSATLAIKDGGQGIADADLPRIFDRFYRADRSRSRDSSGGYGLGLALAKQIAAQHHASIEVSSRPGKGSTFTVTFPLATKH